MESELSPSLIYLDAAMASDFPPSLTHLDAVMASDIPPSLTHLDAVMASDFPDGCTAAATTSPEYRLLLHRTVVSWDRRLKRRAEPSACPARRPSSRVECRTNARRGRLELYEWLRLLGGRRPSSDLSGERASDRTSGGEGQKWIEGEKRTGWENRGILEDFTVKFTMKMTSGSLVPPRNPTAPARHAAPHLVLSKQRCHPGGEHEPMTRRARCVHTPKAPWRGGEVQVPDGGELSGPGNAQGNDGQPRGEGRGSAS